MQVQQADLKRQMATLQTDIKRMKAEKLNLFVMTTTFRRNILSLLGNNQAGAREKSAARARDDSVNILNKANIKVFFSSLSLELIQNLFRLLSSRT